MDTPEQPEPKTADIPQKIFSQLIVELKKTDLPDAVVKQLEKAILTDGNFSEQSLRAALTQNPEI